MPSARERCLRTQKDPQGCPPALFLKARDSSHMAGLCRPCSYLTGQECGRRVTQDGLQVGQGLEEGGCSSPSLFPGREGATCLCVFANRQELRPVIIISSLWCLLTVIN